MVQRFTVQRFTVGRIQGYIALRPSVQNFSGVSQEPEEGTSLKINYQISNMGSGFRGISSINRGLHF